MEQFKLVCPCLFGLESVLAFEAKKLGGREVRSENGRVTFFGDENMIASANINLRTAERVLIELAAFRAGSFDELFAGVSGIAFERYVGKNDRFPVKGWSLNSVLHSVPDCQSIIKKAVVNRLGKAYEMNWFPETGATFQIQFSIHKDIATIMLDTSGAGLHKRGYRAVSTEAPIKETLAAGICDLARIDADSVVVDPMCGSGTILIEAAMRALNIAPGLNRRFAAEKWECIPPEIWSEKRAEALEMIDKTAKFTAIGSDYDEEAIKIAKMNAEKAGVSPRLKFHKADVKNTVLSEGQILITNPPYGERLLSTQKSRELYGTLGEIYDRSCNDFYIIADEGFEKAFGGKAVRRRKLYNGMLKCNLYMYYRLGGSK